MPPPNTTSILEFFKSLPSEIIIEILSRLPIRTIVICKSVCRSWRHLLCSREFIQFHASKSVPGLIIGSSSGPKALKVYEFDDDNNEHHHHHLRLKPLTTFKSITSSMLKASADGLLLLLRSSPENRHALYICNPVTREYIQLPDDTSLVYSEPTIHTYGFGVSRTSGQHKVVKITVKRERNSGEFISHAFVYTLGTGGVWRRITPSPPILFCCENAVYFNGNLHWLFPVLGGTRFIYRFDLENETFSTFSLPTGERTLVGLAVLGDCLCVTDTTCEGDVFIWLMKEYGDEKSWSKEFVIQRSSYVVGQVVNLIKVFGDGDILMYVQNKGMLYYSSKTRTTTETRVFGEELAVDQYDFLVMLHNLNFSSLCRFENERVIRF